MEESAAGLTLEPNTWCEALSSVVACSNSAQCEENGSKHSLLLLLLHVRFLPSAKKMGFGRLNGNSCTGTKNGAKHSPL